LEASHVYIVILSELIAKHAGRRVCVIFRSRNERAGGELHQLFSSRMSPSSWTIGVSTCCLHVWDASIKRSRFNTTRPDPVMLLLQKRKRKGECIKKMVL
jgi:hypothetical protein